MINHRIAPFAATAGWLLLAFSLSSGQQKYLPEVQSQLNSARKSTGPLETTLMDINNITGWISGSGLQHGGAGDWNGTFPKGTAGFIWTEGIVWGGKVNDGLPKTLRVGGNWFGTGCTAGQVLPNGTREPDNAETVRPYRVRRDWETADLRDDAANYNNKQLSQVTDADVEQIRAQYKIDWNNWPWQKGAPYEDRNGDGIYEPDIDIPGFRGSDQTVWTVYNDLDAIKTLASFQSDPIGLEVQETSWAYERTDPLGNVIFKKVRIIYKGTASTPANATIDSMYIVQFADPDDGFFQDDFVGCDTTLSLGFVYNSKTTDPTYFNRFGLPPPAGGFDFLQGPIVPGSPTDSALFDLTYRKGKKNLPMTAFTFFSGNGGRVDPAPGGPGTPTGTWYNLMSGFEPRPEYPARVPIRDHLGNVTKFELTGDPVKGTGDLDGKPTAANAQRFLAGDRRFVMSSGSFTLARGDTQEVVVALVAGLGADYLSSVSVMKYNDRFAQNAYDNLFDLPKMVAPVASVAELDREIILNWGEDLERVKQIEGLEPGGYKFEGYNVYQLPNATATLEDKQTKKIRTFDLVNDLTVIVDEALDEQTAVIITKPAQVGSNSGIQRFLKITKDEIRNAPLVNGQEYHFAVSAYGYNGSSTVAFHSLESPLTRIHPVPQSPKPGVRLHSVFGDTLMVTHSAGKSAGQIWAVVVDPGKVTGDKYSIAFRDTLSGTLVWDLKNVTKSLVVASSSNQGAVITGNPNDAFNYPIIDGLQVSVLGPPSGMNPGGEGEGWAVPKGTRRITWADGDGLGFEGFQTTIGWNAPNNYFFSTGKAVPASDCKNVVLRWAQASAKTTAPTTNGFNRYGGWDENDPGPDENFSYAYRYLRNAAAANPGRPEFAPYIVNQTAGYAYQDYKRSVPLSAWNVEANPPVRLAVGFLENNVAAGLVDGKYYPPTNGAGQSNGLSGPREWLFIFNTPYTGGTPDTTLQKDILNNPLPVMWWCTFNRRADNQWNEPSGSNEFLIIANHPNTVNDLFEFSAPAPGTLSKDLARSDIEKINVFPNPYFGFNSRETSRLNKYVTFNHLPPKAIIRIFNLGGVLLKVIEKDDAGQFMRWDLRNQNNLPVASGIYVVHIEMPDLGMTKILKLALVQEEQVLPVY